MTSHYKVIEQDSKRIKLNKTFEVENEIISKVNISIEQLFIIYFFLENNRAIDLLHHEYFNPNYIINNNFEYSNEIFKNQDEKDEVDSALVVFDGYSIFGLLLLHEDFKMLDIIINNKAFNPISEDSTSINAFQYISHFIEKNKLNCIDLIKTNINYIKKNI